MKAEDKLQIECAKWLDDNLHKDVIWYHVPNEAKAKPQYHAKRKRMGVKSGVPDIVIHWTRFEGRHIHYVVYIELKAPQTYKESEKTGKKIIDNRGGVLSDAQHSFMTKCINNGMTYWVASSLDKVQAIMVNNYIPLKGEVR